MAETETMQTQVLGEQGEPCAACGAPLAADQRYCLNCGQRRAGPRVDYRRHLNAPPAAEEEEGAPSEAPQQPPTAAPAEPPRPERDYAPLAAVGGIAVLGLMLLVGVLIGKGNGGTTTAPAPVVKLGTEATASTPESEETTGSKTASNKAKGSSKKSNEAGTGAKAVNGGLTGSEARNSDATVQASTQDLESLNNTSGEDYEDTVRKLPDKIATPGAPPPIDTTKAAGGGGEAEVIE